MNNGRNYAGSRSFAIELPSAKTSTMAARRWIFIRSCLKAVRSGGGTSTFIELIYIPSTRGAGTRLILQAARLKRRKKREESGKLYVCFASPLFADVCGEDGFVGSEKAELQRWWRRTSFRHAASSPFLQKNSVMTVTLKTKSFSIVLGGKHSFFTGCWFDAEGDYQRSSVSEGLPHFEFL